MDRISIISRKCVSEVVSYINTRIAQLAGSTSLVCVTFFITDKLFKGAMSAGGMRNRVQLRLILHVTWCCIFVFLPFLVWSHLFTRGHRFDVPLFERIWKLPVLSLKLCQLRFLFSQYLLSDVNCWLAYLRQDSGTWWLTCESFFFIGWSLQYCNTTCSWKTRDCLIGMGGSWFVGLRSPLYTCVTSLYICF